MLETVDSYNKEYFRRLVEIKIDTTNILTAVRTMRMRDTTGLFASMFIRGGSLERKFFEKAMLSGEETFFAALAAAIVCPFVNTGMFLLGCYIFFMDSATQIADTLGLTVSGMAVFWALAMGNFFLEIATSLVLSPVIVRILNISKK